MPQDPDDPRLPDALIDDLSRAYRTELRVSPDIDRAITSGARAYLARRGRLRLWITAAGTAAAAAVVLAVVLVHRPPRDLATTAPEDVNGDGVVDIRDALALQQQLNRGSAGAHDVNHDGVTDRGDVDAIAALAVRLDGGSAMKPLLAILLTAMLLGAAPAPATSEEAVRFATVDVRIDAKGKPLAAYQVEFIADPSRVKLVGIEGGDHAAFKEPPYYDPAALSGNRVIIAAFNAGADLPGTAFRAARLHVQITGSEKPRWEAKLIVAAGADGASIPAAVTLEEGVAP